jgi:hypothetical protein
MISDVLGEARDEILEHLADCMDHYPAGVQREIADVILAMDQLRLRWACRAMDETPLTPPGAMQHLADSLRDWRRDHYGTLLRDWHGTAH